MIRLPYDRFRHHRGSLRLRGYDYTRASAYFVTIRAAGTGDIFGSIVEGSVVLNDLGLLVKACWQAIPEHFPGVRLDAWVVMPDHFHGIVILPHGVPEHWRLRRSTIVPQTPNRTYVGAPVEYPTPNRSCVGAQHAAPLHKNNPLALVPPGSLGAIVRSFKSAASREINRILDTPGGSAWQRNYHERILRNEGELAAYRQYIKDNPARWGLDKDDERMP